MAKNKGGRGQSNPGGNRSLIAGMVLGNDGPLSNKNQMRIRGERMPDLKDAPSSRKGIKHLI